MKARFVVLGLAPPRSPWFTDVSRWSTAGTLPLEFLRCISADELRVRLGSGRVFSAALLDGTHPAVDRDLIAACAEFNCTTVLLDDSPTDWMSMGATAVTSRRVSASEIGDLLRAHAVLVEPADEIAADPIIEAVPWRGSLVTVVGTGGCGTSTIAAGIARSMSHNSRCSVLLADLARRADQALLHNTRSVVPALPELVERYRTGAPDAQTLRSMTFAISDGGYDLLVGMRRPNEWTALRPRAVAAALEGVRSAWDVVVADSDCELDGQETTGSVDMEERNCLSRVSCSTADVVVVVTRHGLTGVAALVRTVADLRNLGVHQDAVVPVVNRAPRGFGQREVLRCWTALAESGAVRPPLVLPFSRSVESSARNATPAPGRLARPVVAAVSQVLDARHKEAVAPLGHQPGNGAVSTHISAGDLLAPVRIQPGSLGAIGFEMEGESEAGDDTR